MTHSVTVMITDNDVAAISGTRVRGQSPKGDSSDLSGGAFGAADGRDDRD